MAITLDTVALTATQKSDTVALTNGAQRIASIANAIVTNTNATFAQAKTFVDALEVEQGSQGSRLSSLEALVDSSDTALDTLQEIVDFVKLNRTDLNALGISGISGLQGALDTLQSNIDSQAEADAAEVVRLEGKIDTNTDDINSIKDGTFILTSAAFGSDADWGLE